MLLKLQKGTETIGGRASPLQPQKCLFKLQVKALAYHGFLQLIAIVPIWGNIVVYMTSYFRIFDDSITMHSTFLVFPLTLASAALGMQLGSVLMDYLHPRVQLALGGGIYVLSLYVSSYQTNFYLYLFFYSVVVGISYGTIYMIPLKLAYAFYPNNKGQVGGIILASSSIGAIVWTFLSVGLVNPQNEMPKLYLKVGNALEVLYGPQQKCLQNVPLMLRTLAIVFAVLLLISIILTNKKKDLTFEEALNEELLLKGIVPEGGVQRAVGPNKNLLSTDSFNLSDNGSNFGGSQMSVSGISDLSRMTLKESVQEKTFWHIFAMITLSMSYCFFIKVVFKNYGSINFNDDQFLTAVAGISFLCGGSAKFIWGILQDYIGFKKVYACILFFETLIAFTMIQVSASRVLYAMWISITFACEGGHASIFPALVCTLYGAEQAHLHLVQLSFRLGSKVYSLLFIGKAIASLVGLMVSSIILPLFGWETVFLIFGLMNLSSLFLLLMFTENRELEPNFIPEESYIPPQKQHKRGVSAKKSKFFK